MDEGAEKAVLDELKQRCDEGIPKGEARLKRIQDKKKKPNAAKAALEAVGDSDQEKLKEAAKRAKDAADDEREVQAELDGLIAELPEVEKGQAGGDVDADKMKGAGGRDGNEQA